MIFFHPSTNSSHLFTLIISKNLTPDITHGSICVCSGYVIFTFSKLTISTPPVLVGPGIRTVIDKTAFNAIHIGAVR